MVLARRATRLSTSVARLSTSAANQSNVCIIGGGMVGAATALHLADAGVKNIRVLCAQSSGLPSSSDDVTRLVGTGGAADDVSTRGFPRLQERSGIAFWADCGLLEVGPATVHSLLPAQQDHMAFESFFGARGCATTFTEHSRGWLNPRGFIQAARTVAEASGAAEWTSANATSIRGELGDFTVSLADGGEVRANVVVCSLGAFAPLSPCLTQQLAVPLLETTMWGKVVYHARLSPASAAELADMPPLVVKPDDGCVPVPTVSYAGAKQGMYFYLFPPVTYADGAAYIKIGHSPYDPIIASLGYGQQEGPEGAPHAAPTAAAHTQPSAEQVRAWFAGAQADTSTAMGREVVRTVEQSEAFFRDVLQRLFPDARFEGGYGSTCVTAKSATGDRLLSELLPGLLHQTGCNGSGAGAALAWGGEVSEAVLATLSRRP